MELPKQKGIDPKSITKPIQLVAAWLAGLVLVDSAFLFAATALVSIPWAAASLVIASIINVPLFLISIFLLQTKFRPEMQEDHYYHEYLKNKAGVQLGKGFQPKSGIIEEKSTGSRENGWEGILIMFNPHLKGSAQVKEHLINSNIPINDEFGAPSWINSFVVAIGRYLNYKQISELLDSLDGTNANRIGFANDDDEIYQWDKTVLVGAYWYDVEDTTISLRQAKNILAQSDGDVKVFYDRIFHKQRYDDT